MEDSVEELIREIAAKHGVAVSPDDPILILRTINARLMQDTAKAQQGQLDRFKEEMEGVALRWSHDAREKSERILNAALAGGKAAVAEIMHDVARTTASAVATETQAALERATISLRRGGRMALVNLVASGMTLVAAALAAWTLLR